MLQLRRQGVAASSSTLGGRPYQRVWQPAWRSLPRLMPRQCVRDTSNLPALDSVTTEELYDKHKEACPTVHDTWLDQVGGDESYWCQPLSACTLPNTANRDEETILQLSGALLKTASLHLREHPQVPGIVQVIGQPTRQPPAQPIEPQWSNQNLSFLVAVCAAVFTAVFGGLGSMFSSGWRTSLGLEELHGAETAHLVIVNSAAAALSIFVDGVWGGNDWDDEDKQLIITILLFTLACMVGVGLGWDHNDVVGLSLTTVATAAMCTSSVRPELVGTAMRTVRSLCTPAEAETFLGNAALSMPVSVKEWVQGATEALAFSLQLVLSSWNKQLTPALSMAHAISLVALHTLGLQIPELGQLALQAASSSMIANAPLLYAASLHTSIATNSLPAASTKPFAPLTIANSLTCNSTSFTMLAAALAQLLACQTSTTSIMQGGTHLARLLSTSDKSSHGDSTNNTAHHNSLRTDVLAPYTTTASVTCIQGYSYISTRAPDYSTPSLILHTLLVCLAAKPALLPSMPKEQLLATCSSLVSAMQWAATGRSLPKEHRCTFITSSMWVELGEKLLKVLKYAARSEVLSCQHLSSVLDVEVRSQRPPTTTFGASNKFASAEQLAIACSDALVALKECHV